MGILLTTAQVADHIQNCLAGPDGYPRVTPAKVHAQLAAGLFTNVGPGRSVRIDIDEVDALLTQTRYIPDPAEIGALVLRVSVTARRPDVVYAFGVDPTSAQPLRTDAGIDFPTLHSQPLTASLGGFEGVWEVSDPVADRLADEDGLLLATCKGYTDPDMVQTIEEWTRCADTPRKYFFTRQAPKAVRDVVGTGVWIDVPPGRESGILVG